MKQSHQVFFGLLGLGALLLLGSSSEASERQVKDAPKDAPSVPPPKEAPETDPLPEYELTQPNVIEAITEFTESGQTDKVKSVVVKSLSAAPSMRAYVVAALSAVPAQLRADLAFIKQFDIDEAARIAAIKAQEKKTDAIVAATESAVVAVVTKVNAVAGAVLALGVALGEAAKGIIRNQLPIEARRGADQIYPIREGYGMRRGVLFQPDLPYITRGEIELSDKVRKRWIDESAEELWFAALPELPSGTALRFAPRWDDYRNAVAKLRANGIA